MYRVAQSLRIGLVDATHLPGDAMMRRRPLRLILAQPMTATEERRADAHIRVAAERIRAGWSPAEHRRRAGLQRASDPPPRYSFPVVDARLLGER